MFSKGKYLLVLTVGLLICKPAVSFCEVARPWEIRVEEYGLDNEHIAGDTFMVEVRFKNRTAYRMSNVTAELHYPEGTEPLLAKFHERKVTRFPWNGHFIDYNNRLVRFQFPYPIANSEERFYAFFCATKYGKLKFDYTIRWQSGDSLLYENTREGQTVHFLSSDSSSSISKERSGAAAKSSPGVSNSTRTARLGGIISLVMILLWVLLFLLLLVSDARSRRRWRELKKRTDILIEVQKKLVSLEIERSTKDEEDL
ncbi:hypothetical protein DRQ19_03670 [bacterium]|nr:MAG: hypothetical protein DRQ19_03670 [bacterium]